MTSEEVVNNSEASNIVHQVKQDGYIVSLTDDSGIEAVYEDVSLNETINISFIGSANIAVSHSDNIDSARLDYVLSADQLSASDNSPLEIAMYNKDWHAVSVSCQFVTAAKLDGMTEQQCSADAVTFYQKDTEQLGNNITVDFENGASKEFALSESGLFSVGTHNHFTFVIDGQTNPPEFVDSSSWNYEHQEVALDDVDGATETKIKGADEVELLDNSVRITAFGDEPNSMNEDKYLSSPYNMITLIGTVQASGYPLKAYLEPKVDADVLVNGVESDGFMKLYLNSGTKSDHPDVFTIYFNTQGEVDQIANQAGVSYPNWGAFVTDHSDSLVNSAYFSHDIDLEALLGNVEMPSLPECRDSANFINCLIDQFMGDNAELIEELKESGDDYMHVGNFVWRSNDSTNKAEVSVELREFTTGVKADYQGGTSTVHQQNSQGFDSFAFDGVKTDVNWTSAEPKVWLKDFSQGQSIETLGIENLVANVSQNPGSYINIYLSEGEKNRCVTIMANGTFNLSPALDTASCKATNEDQSFDTLEELYQATSNMTVRTDYFDVLNRGNFFWRGVEMETQSASFNNYTLMNN
ncbi:hypothetical protein JCM19236_2379 [Vibrio sp. JCM 19236]|nr:hypothetical protein JCM19236_2379 [Vibrio sp. JCM 19236]